MFEPSRTLFTCHIAGFQYYDGALVLSELKPGMTLDLVPVLDNPHDPEAVAVKYNGIMTGYIPAHLVGPLSAMCYFGHRDVFECRVLQVAPENDPWEQVRIGVLVRDCRTAQTFGTAHCDPQDII